MAVIARIQHQTLKVAGRNVAPGIQFTYWQYPPPPRPDWARPVKHGLMVEIWQSRTFDQWQNGHYGSQHAIACPPRSKTVVVGNLVGVDAHEMVPSTPDRVKVSKAPKEIVMSKTATQQLTEAVQLYLDLMYDCDIGTFDRVFGSTSQLHGFREGKMTCWTAAQYKEVLANRKSPRALGSPREEQILLLDFASPSQALAKVRVRINDMVFVDYLSYHKLDERWLITSKAYHREV